MKVVLDTNFIILPFTKKIDIYEEIKTLIPGEKEIITTDYVVEEIIKTQKNHKVIIELLKRNASIIETKEKPVDNDTALIELCKKETAIIATNDSDLRKKAKKAGIKTIFLRQGKTLRVE